MVVHARPSFFLGRGTLSLRADEIRPVGIGELLARIERLRKLLAAEGLFAPERKRPPFRSCRRGGWPDHGQGPRRPNATCFVNARAPLARRSGSASINTAVQGRERGCRRSC